MSDLLKSSVVVVFFSLELDMFTHCLRGFSTAYDSNEAWTTFFSPIRLPTSPVRDSTCISQTISRLYRSCTLRPLHFIERDTGLRLIFEQIFEQRAFVWERLVSFHFPCAMRCDEEPGKYIVRCLVFRDNNTNAVLGGATSPCGKM